MSDIPTGACITNGENGRERNMNTVNPPPPPTTTDLNLGKTFKDTHNDACEELRFGGGGVTLKGQLPSLGKNSIQWENMKGVSIINNEYEQLNPRV